jgi:hypothetical protein
MHGHRAAFREGGLKEDRGGRWVGGLIWWEYFHRSNVTASPATVQIAQT